MTLEPGPLRQGIGKALAGAASLAGHRNPDKLTALHHSNGTPFCGLTCIVVENHDPPTPLILSRRRVPALDRFQLAPTAGLRHGAHSLDLGERDHADRTLSLLQRGP
ncbi:MAG TPA: hypothetical protein VMK12_10590 [Anaeromyxobacteraceae bacterium]|nr:hypothetical protein [Anaeromyxobacteraceae bacterium]